MGIIHLILSSRKEKIPHDCHFTIQCSRRLADGSCQLPIVVLHVNIPPSHDPNIPTLLTLGKRSFQIDLFYWIFVGLVENLFHEFGHAMHSVLARTRYQHASGTRCQTDIAEIPSQWMEYFVYEPRVVKLFARHYQTNQVIPDELLRRLHLAQNAFQAHRTQIQVNPTFSFSTIPSLNIRSHLPCSIMHFMVPIPCPNPMKICTHHC